MIKLFEQFDESGDKLVFWKGQKITTYFVDSYKKKGYSLYSYKKKDMILSEVKISKNINYSADWKPEFGDLLVLLDSDNFNKISKLVDKTKNLIDLYLEKVDLHRDHVASSIYYLYSSEKDSEK
jgi:hypothetical protein